MFQVQRLNIAISYEIERMWIITFADQKLLFFIYSEIVSDTIHAITKKPNLRMRLPIISPNQIIVNCDS